MSEIISNKTIDGIYYTLRRMGSSYFIDHCKAKEVEKFGLKSFIGPFKQKEEATKFFNDIKKLNCNGKI